MKKRRMTSQIETLERRTLLSAWAMGLPAAIHSSTSNDAGHPSGQFLAYPMSENLGPATSTGSASASPAAVYEGTPFPLALAPAQVQQAYGFSNIILPNGSSATGAGETIGIVDAFHDPNLQSDLHTFDVQYFGGVDPNFNQVNLGSSTNVDTTGGWEIEEALDVEWAHSIAPQANIILVEAASNSYTDLFTAVDKAVALGANVVSMSWGGGENTSFDSHFSVANVTFVACSGDNGAPPWYPAVSPNVLGVGGTTLSLDSNNNWSSEAGWWNSGGGISANEPRPSFQPTTYTNGSTGGIALTKRGVPDVAYDASNISGISVYDSYQASNPPTINNRALGRSYGWVRANGTSCGAPQWAALVALADQGRAQAALAPLGTAQTLTTLYANPGDFHDITSGSSLGNPNYNPGAGYDLVTGLGTPQAPLVVSSLIGIAPTSAPATPNGVSATPADGKVSLKWNASSGATGWNIYRSTDGINYTAYASISGTSFVDNGLTDGNTYYYEVTAVNSVGESAPSAVVSTTPQLPPAAPTSVSASASYSTVGVLTYFAMTLQWNASTGASSYNVLRSSTSGSGYAVIASGITSTSYVDPNVYAATSYYFVVQAVNAAGAVSSNSAQVTGTAFPTAPQNLTATAGNNNVALAWGASTGATSYIVLRSTTNGSGYSVIASGITTTSFTDSKVTVGTTYYYVVEAVDAGGASVYSNQASATGKHGGGK